MADGKFIQVLLPLKLDWEPYYALPEGTSAQVGDAVEVVFAGRKYNGIVTAVDVTPEGIDPKSILTIETSGTSPKVTTTLSPSSQGMTSPSSSGLTRGSLPFWRTLAEYYLCTTGEVYKASAVKTKIKETPDQVGGDETSFAGTPLSSFAGLTGEPMVGEIKAAFAKKKTVLLTGENRDEIYRILAAETLAQNKSVLHLIPTQKKSTITEVAKSGEARYIVGTRSAIFLPWKNLGLVVVDDEHDASYKQDSPAPRFGAREAAIMLANLHGANVILGSETPSLESLYNAETGLFTKVELKQSLRQEITLINTASEARKKGMSGAFSFKLLEAIGSTLDAGKKVLLLCRSKQAIPEADQELKNLFPEAPEKAIVTACPLTLKTKDPAAFGLVAFLQADALLGKEDFRSDERALQTLQHLAAKAPLAIQTREPGHPVFKALEEGGNGLTFLEERRMCGLPPFTRLVNLVIRDHSEKRIEFLSKQLAEQIRRSSRRMTEVGPSSFAGTSQSSYNGTSQSSFAGTSQSSFAGTSQSSFNGTSQSSFAGLTGESIVGPYIPSYQQEGEYIRIIRVTLARDKFLKARKQAIYQTVKNFEKEYRYTGHIVIDVDPV